MIDVASLLRVGVACNRRLKSGEKMPNKRPQNAEHTQFRSGAEAVENGRKGGIAMHYFSVWRHGKQI